jgi:hypothetical protein
MTNTNDEARVLCPRTCIDCCCQEHHWGDYSNNYDESGEQDDNCMGCKHCGALLDYTEPCTLCGKELIDHDTDSFACDPEADGDDAPKFTYAGQPKRECKRVHPWDEARK